MTNVLILDNNLDLANMLGEYVKTILGFNVTCLTREEDFWALVKEQDFDVLFLDYRLDNSTGIEILDEMRSQGIKIPTIMLTGEGNEKIAVNAIQKGAIDYLVKGDLPLEALPAYIHKAVQMRELRRTMESSLKKIQYQSMLLDSILDAVVVWDRQGLITYWNKAAEELFGLMAGQTIGKPAAEVYFTLFDPPISSSALGQQEKLLEEHRLTRPNGSVTWISSQISALFDDRHETIVSGYMDVSRDVSARKVEQETLRTSQHLIQQILDTIPNIIYIVDLPETRLTYVSNKVKDLIGKDWVELVNSDVSAYADHIHPDDLPRLQAHYAQLIGAKDNTSLLIEFRFLDPFKQWRWLSCLETVFSRDPDGKVREVLGIYGDISPLKLVETQLRDRLNSEELAMNISTRFINLTGENTGQEISRALKTVMYFVKAEFGAIALQQEGRFQVNTLVEQSSAGEAGAGLQVVLPATIENRLLARFKEGQVFYLQDLSGPIPGGKHWMTKLVQYPALRSILGIALIYKDEVFGLLIFGSLGQEIEWKTEFDYLLRDFSQVLVNGLVQARYDQALRKSEEQYRVIVEDHQTELICRFTPDLSLTFVNEAFCNFFEQNREELIGSSLAALASDDDLEAFRDAIRSIESSLPVTTVEQEVSRPQRKTRWQEWVLRGIRGKDQAFVEFQGVGREITDRKEMEEKIGIAQTRLAQSTRLASIGQLASSVAHQISNPLTTIIANAQLLAHDPATDETLRDSATSIVEAGWRVQQVVDELLQFSQPEQTISKAVDIRETIQKAILLAGPHLQNAQIELHLDLPDHLPAIEGYPQRLVDLWVNLLLTAYSGPAASTRNIWIGSALLEDRVEISIRDDGPPIPIEQQELIFEPQLLPAGQGRGLGMELSLCREIVRQHGGEISLSIVDNCTTFQLFFPTRE